MHGKMMSAGSAANSPVTWYPSVISPRVLKCLPVYCCLVDNMAELVNLSTWKPDPLSLYPSILLDMDAVLNKLAYDHGDDYDQKN
jgi:hypothetical protein